MRRMNVALTRARRSLFVVGHSATLAGCEPWRVRACWAAWRAVLGSREASLLTQPGTAHTQPAKLTPMLTGAAGALPPRAVPVHRRASIRAAAGGLRRTASARPLGARLVAPACESSTFDTERCVHRPRQLVTVHVKYKGVVPRSGWITRSMGHVMHRTVAQKETRWQLPAAAHCALLPPPPVLPAPPPRPPCTTLS